MDGYKTPIFIKLLEYGEQIGLAGTDFKELCNWFEKQNLLLEKSNSNENKTKKLALLRELFFETYVKNSGSTENKWVLKTKYYFRLLEYREIVMAKKSSKQANRNAWIAIILSFLTFIISYSFSISNQKTPIIINQDQFKLIQQSIFNSRDLLSKDNQEIIKAINNLQKRL
jgi:hypothetical protein